MPPAVFCYTFHMTFLHSIILGIVEGITEFLPISSTGHLILASKLLGIADSEFLKSFEIFIQLGAILAVVYYYRKTVFTSIETWKKVLAAFIPTGIIGFIVYKAVKTFLLGSALTVVYSLVIGGIILIIFEKWQQKKIARGVAARFDTVEEVPYRTAIYVGLAQVLAVIPGVSRSGTTIVAGQSLSLSRKAVVEFSFLLAIPTMLAASGLDLLKSGWAFGREELILLAVGFVVSFVVALVVIRWLLSYVQGHSFVAFGIYRILAGLIFFFVFF
jgi:undecaprenyl-diphosphatase